MALNVSITTYFVIYFEIFSEDSEVVIHSNDPIAPVGYLIFKKLSLEVKLPVLDLNSRLEGLPLKDSNGYITDQNDEEFEAIENQIGKLISY